MRLLLSTLLLCHALHLSAAEEPLPNPILNPDTPWIYTGFSVNTPAGPGWVSYFRSGQSAALGKTTDDANHIFGVNVLSTPIAEPVRNADELAAQLKTSRPSLVDLAEFSVTSRRESPAQVNGYWCSQYTMTAEAKKPDPLHYLYIAGISCADPQNPQLLVDVGVSDLTGAGEMAAQLVPIAKRLGQSIKFVPRIKKEQSEAVSKALSTNDIKGALAILQPRAQAGDSRAAFLMADVYLNAKEDQDYALARKWLEISAAQGERDALYQMGSMYDKGLGVDRNLEQAVKWFQLAADQRDSQAQLNLGILHDPRAEGYAKDAQLAAQWFVLAANNGNKRAKQILEHHYRKKSQ
ncbi:MAG: tetratricopeptide repeat protein [Burkholderiales bacterium]